MQHPHIVGTLLFYLNTETESAAETCDYIGAHIAQTKYCLKSLNFQ
jgi:hypothetical protein